MLIEQFNELLETLGKNIGLSNLKADKAGLCSLRFGNTITIDLECNEERGALIISTLIGTLNSKTDKEKVYTELLEANLLWRGTGGATLGIDSTTKTVFMCYQEPMSLLNFNRFQELLKGFSDTAIFWNKHLSEKMTQE